MSWAHMHYCLFEPDCIVRLRMRWRKGEGKIPIIHTGAFSLVTVVAEVTQGIGNR